MLFRQDISGDNGDCESGDSTSAHAASTCYLKPSLSNIIDIKATSCSFFALSSSGTAVGWGEAGCGVVWNMNSFPATNRMYMHVKIQNTVGISFVLMTALYKTLVIIHMM